MTNIFKAATPLSEDDQRLVDQYVNTGLSVDELPYTDDFDHLVESLRGAGDQRSNQEIYRRLLNLRKAARLPRVGRSSLANVVASDQELEVLEDLLPQFSATVGQRDRLAFDPQFDHLVEAFNRKTDRDFTKHEVWRLVLRVAK